MLAISIMPSVRNILTDTGSCISMMDSLHRPWIPHIAQISARTWAGSCSCAVPSVLAPACEKPWPAAVSPPGSLAASVACRSASVGCVWPAVSAVAASAAAMASCASAWQSISQKLVDG